MVHQEVCFVADFIRGVGFPGEFRLPFPEIVPTTRLMKREIRQHFPDSSIESVYEAKDSTCIEERIEDDFDYITANCQLVINPSDGDEGIYVNPDVRIDWSNVVYVKCFQTEKSSCPICLELPLSPRITPCGHIYCFPCVWRYITFENDTGLQKCAVCHYDFMADELKRVQILPSHIPKVGDTIDLELMRRSKTSIFPSPTRSNDSQARDLSSRFLSRWTNVHLSDLEALVNKDIKSMEEYLSDCEAFKAYGDSLAISRAILGKLKTERKALNNIVIKDTPRLSEDTAEDDSYFYYQGMLNKYFVYLLETTGHDIYLHGLNFACINADFTISNLPHIITGKVLDIETYTMNKVCFFLLVNIFF